MYFTAFTCSTKHSSTGLLSNSDSESSLLSNNISGNVSLLSPLNSNDAGIDAFGGKDMFGTPDFSNPNAAFFADVPQTETTGSIAYDSAETIGSVAFNSAETAGSVACAGAGVSCGGDSGGFSSVC